MRAKGLQLATLGNQWCTLSIFQPIDPGWVWITFQITFPTKCFCFHTKIKVKYSLPRWWFQIFFIFTAIWGNDPF